MDMSTNLGSSKKKLQSRQESRMTEIRNLALTSGNKNLAQISSNGVLLKNQQIAMSRLARSKWRRDPIKERLLFLTGVGSSRVESPDYVNYLEGILAEKHFERECSEVKSLAGLEVDREWLWRVKKEVDFAALEKQSLEEERAATAAETAHERDRQGALLSPTKEMDLYTIAKRTYGLDANRNVEKVIQSHQQNMQENAENGQGYVRSTWLLDLTERNVEALAPLIAANDARDIFVAAEDIIRDIPTVADQEEEEAEQDEERTRKETEGEGE